MRKPSPPCLPPGLRLRLPSLVVERVTARLLLARPFLACIALVARTSVAVASCVGGEGERCLMAFSLWIRAVCGRSPPE